MGVDLLPPAPTMGGGQMAPQMPHSGLAAALMGHGGMPMGGGAGAQIPLSTILELIKGGQQGGALDGLGSGIGNLMRGYQWDGMPGGSMMDQLNAQAQGYAAGGAAGL